MDRQLHALGLERYEPALLDEGFESIQDLRNATMEDYLAVGLKIGHARRLLTAMAQDQVAIDAGEDTVETAAKTDAGESVVTDTKKDYIAVDTKSGHARGPSHPGHQALVASYKTFSAVTRLQLDTLFPTLVDYGRRGRL